jgi:hypothetical protein
MEPSKSMANALSLPADIVYRVVQDLVDALLDDPNDVDGLFKAYAPSSLLVGNLRACALVGRDWAVPCRRALFRVIDIDSTAELERVCEVLEGDSALQQCVQAVGLKPSAYLNGTHNLEALLRRFGEAVGAVDHIVLNLKLSAREKDPIEPSASTLTRTLVHSGLVSRKTVALRVHLTGLNHEFNLYGTLRPYASCLLARPSDHGGPGAPELEEDVDARLANVTPLELESLVLHACPTLQPGPLISKIGLLRLVVLSQEMQSFPTPFLRDAAYWDDVHIEKLHLDAATFEDWTRSPDRSGERRTSSM